MEPLALQRKTDESHPLMHWNSAKYADLVVVKVAFSGCYAQVNNAVTKYCVLRG
jgi:hypothetical protein